MRTDVSLTQERLVPAGPAAVWRVVADPATPARLDDRVSLVSRAGDDGLGGSAYVLARRIAPAVDLELRYEVTQAEPERCLVVHVTRAGATYGEQRTELLAHPDGTLVRATLTVSVGPVSAPSVETALGRQLTAWLAGVERLALDVPPA